LLHILKLEASCMTDQNLQYASKQVSFSLVTHFPYGITHCYLPPDRGDSPDFTLAFTNTHFTVLQKVEGSKGAQPVPKAVYRSGCDKHKAAVGFDPGI